MGWFLLEWKTAAARAVANAAAGDCTDTDEPDKGVTVGSRGWVGLATMAWPLVSPSSSTVAAIAATAAAFSPVDTSWSDLMVVALPQGTTTTWQYDQAAATAAAQAAVQFKSPFGHRWGNGKGRRTASGGKTSSTPSNSGSGSAKQQRSWFETPYAAAWQYNPAKSTGYAYFMATSWAALWPVFLVAAVQRSSILTPQVRFCCKG